TRGQAVNVHAGSDRTALLVAPVPLGPVAPRGQLFLDERPHQRTADGENAQGSGPGAVQLEVDRRQGIERVGRVRLERETTRVRHQQGHRRRQGGRDIELAVTPREVRHGTGEPVASGRALESLSYS